MQQIKNFDKTLQDQLLQLTIKKQYLDKFQKLTNINNEL